MSDTNAGGQVSEGTQVQPEEKKLRLLITDDSRLLRKKLREDLENLGCEVLEASNGREAIEMDMAHEPDGVILDIVMPEVGGIEALQVIREVSPNVPVVMLSSAGTPQKLMQTLKMGAIDFIQKPYTKEQIVRAVKAIRRAREKFLKKAAESESNS
ncbi:MAG: response regulator [Selenomonadaceae bacterium]|nr:response regulator [Selenomonadaceae bacterium]